MNNRRKFLWITEQATPAPVEVEPDIMSVALDIPREPKKKVTKK